VFVACADFKLAFVEFVSVESWVGLSASAVAGEDALN